MRKKFLQGAATLSMAAAVCIMSGLVTASAAETLKDNVTVDYEKQQIVVDLGGKTDSDSDSEGDVTGQAEGDTSTDDNETQTPPATVNSSDHEILFNVASVDRNKKLKASTWEVYDIKDNKVTIDISSLNTQKDNYVQIKGDVTKDPVTLLIPATDKTVKLKFDAYTGLAYADKGADASKTANYEYRTQYSDWMEPAKLADISLKLYQERGAKLYFRLSANQDKPVKVTADKVTDIKDKATDKALDDVYKMPSLPGKELKVSVGKKANGPKASVSYTKGTVTIPKGALYRVNDENGLGEFSSTATSDKVTLNSSSTGDAKVAFDKLVAGGSLEVKKAGDAGKKKAESKVFLLEFPNAKETLTLTGDKDNDVNNNKIADPADETKFVTATSEEVKNSKSEVTSLKLTVKNDTDYNYEVIVDKTEPAADKRGKIAKAGKTATVTRIDKGGSTVWIRRCADQKKAEWTTDYVKMGVIPAAAEEKPGTGDTKVTSADLQAIAEQLLAGTIELSTTGSGTINIGKDGAAFDLTTKDFTIKDAGSKDKTIKDVTVTLGDITGDDSGSVLAKDDNGLKYGTLPAALGSLVKAEDLSVTITISHSDVSEGYTHTIKFTKGA